MRHLLSAVASISLLGASPLAAEASHPIASSSQLTTQQAVVGDPGHSDIPVVIWAPASPAASLPLVVISHGTGAGSLSHIDTAKALAEAGFVVVAPMHPGDNFQDDSAVGKPTWFTDRSRHVSKVIDFMLSHWEGHSGIDRDRIGIFGFSAGATTALVVSGGELDLTRVGPHCAARPEFVCKIMMSSPDSAPAESRHDPRIRAAVLAAPGLGFAFDPKTLASLRVPIQLWAGSADDTVPYDTNTALVRNALPDGVDFHDVPDAVHLSFLTPCTAETPPFLCQDKPGFDRVGFHAKFNREVIDFLQRSMAPGAYAANRQ